MITNLRSIWRMAWWCQSVRVESVLLSPHPLPRYISLLLERALRDILRCNAVSFSTYIFLNKRLKFSVASKLNEKSPFWSVCDNI